MNSYKKYLYLHRTRSKTLKTMRGNQQVFHTKITIPMRKYIALCLMLCVIQLVTAQFQVQYTHVNPLKFSLEDFNKVQIISTTDQPSVRVRYALLDDKKKKICEVNFKLLPMVKGLNKLNYATGELVWHNSPYRDLLIKNQLVSGNFQLCVAVTDLYESIPEADECFDVELQSQDIINDLNLNPIELQSPSHKDTIDEIRPMLTWIPPSPTYQGTNYQILLVEKRENQTCTEALNNNLPLIHKKDVLTNILNYPTDAQALEKGHKYCWRASAHKDLKEYSRSEDWEFFIREEEKKKENVPLLGSINGSNIFLSKSNSVKFAIDNYSNQKELVIKISNYDNPKDSREIKIALTYGYNILELSNENFSLAKKFVVNCIVNSNSYDFYVLLQN